MNYNSERQRGGEKKSELASRQHQESFPASQEAAARVAPDNLVAIHYSGLWPVLHKL